MDDERPMMSTISHAATFKATYAALLELWEMKAVCGATFATICAGAGCDYVLVLTLWLAMFCDFLFGVADACKRRHFRCRTMERGAQKLVWYFIYMGLVWMVNVAISHSVGFDSPLLNWFLAYLTLTEAVSIVAHLKSLGVPIPPLLLYIVNRSKKGVEEKVEQAFPDTEEPSQQDEFQRNEIGPHRH
jgi:toxin secretion/phage lysis holin